MCALWSPAGKGLTSWPSFVVSNFEFVTFPLVSWIRCVLDVSIPDICTLTYMQLQTKRGAKVSKCTKIRNRYNQVPHLTQDTNGKVTKHTKLNGQLLDKECYGVNIIIISVKKRRRKRCNTETAGSNPTITKPLSC